MVTVLSSGAWYWRLVVVAMSFCGGALWWRCVVVVAIRSGGGAW